MWFSHCFCFSSFSLLSAVCVKQKSSVDVIQKNWFAVTSRKSSTAAEVQSYLSAFESIHLPLLFAIVNLADADVRIAYLLYHIFSFFPARHYVRSVL